MKFSYYDTDMAADSLEKNSLSEIADVKELSHGIVRRTANLRSKELADKIGRGRGVYVTFDCPLSVFDKEKSVSTLTEYIASSLVGMAGVQGKSARVLAVGLGNDEIAADRLGDRTVKMLRVSPVCEADRKRRKVRLSAVSVGVEGVTGIRTAEVIEGVCSRIEPSCVLAIDSLATASPERLGTSFQLTMAGITPSGGVGVGKTPVNRETLGVPVIGIGVPLVLSLRTALSEFAGEYTAAIGCKGNEYQLRRIMDERKLGCLVVAPKDVKSRVELAASVIAGAVNLAFGE